MAQWWNNLVTGLGQQNAPFGFAPGTDPYQAGMQQIGNIGAGMLANSTSNPLEAFGRGYLGSQEIAQQNSKEAFAAKQMMDQAEEKRLERQAQAEQQAQMEEAISGLPPEQQALARIMPEKYFGNVIEGQFQTAQADEFGLNPVPLWNRKTKEYVGMGQLSKSGGVYFNGGKLAGDSDVMPMDPRSLAMEKSAGSLEGSAPKFMVERYTKEIRPAMIQTAEALSAVGQAKKLIPKIQAGSGAEISQAIRGWGATMGLNVDESVLSDTQAYQNFIGNIVIPKMQQLGGNDSNEEMRKMYSLSGGDITQARAALTLTIEYTDKLLRQRMAQYKAQEEFVLPYLSGLPSVEQVPGSGITSPVTSEGEVTYNPKTGEFE
jgi:hypothetical protein